MNLPIIRVECRLAIVYSSVHSRNNIDINLYGSELPRCRGVNIANHSILEGVAQGADTLHYIDEEADTRPTIDREHFNISDSNTAHDVCLKTQDAPM